MPVTCPPAIDTVAPAPINGAYPIPLVIPVLTILPAEGEPVKNLSLFSPEALSTVKSVPEI